MAQNLGDNVTIRNFYAQNGFIAERGDSNETIYEFSSDYLIANESITFTRTTYLDSTSSSSFPSNIVFEAPRINMESEIRIRSNNKNSITFSNASVNFDSATYTGRPNFGLIYFSGASSLNITSSTNGKTIIKASTLTGTVSLDVESGVQDGDTFLIEATDNQLVITDGDWTATPSTSGNITTYTLSKATLQKPKFRLLYTVG